MRIAVIVGVRPHFVKLSALHPALARRFDVRVVHTGQHYDPELSGRFFTELGLPAPHHRFEVGSGSHAQQTARAMCAVEEALTADPVDGAVVIGDSNTTLAAALAAAKMSIPVAHVEAGVRSFDPGLPEEVNRLAIDAVSTLHLCGSARAREQLAREGHADTTTIVGDLLLDLLQIDREAIEKAAGHWRRTVPGTVGATLVTMHRAATLRSPADLKAVVEGVLTLAQPAVFVLHPATRAALETAGLLDVLTGTEDVVVLPAQPHTELMALASLARQVYTDSNGLQRETLFLGKPCGILRDSVEFHESLDHGAVLVGTDVQRITEAGRSMAPPSDLGSIHAAFGGGHAADNIADAIEKWF